VCGVVLLLGVLALAPLGTSTAAAKPLKFKKFTLGTTEVVETPSLKGGTIDEYAGIANQPYAFTQAGGHPDALTTSIEFADEKFEETSKGEKYKQTVPVRDPKDIVGDLPQGLLGDPQAVPRCELTQILDKGSPCPSSTQVGVAVVRVFGGAEYLGPIVNLTPETGQSAEFGFENDSKFTYVATAHVVRSGSTYGLTLVSNELPMTEIVGVELTFWGVPAEASHNPQRGLFCERNGPVLQAGYSCHGGHESSSLEPIPFVTLPTACSAGPETATLRVDSWEEPGIYAKRSVVFPGVSGCDALQFDPSIHVQPETLLADEPTGLAVNVKVPQAESPAVPATPELRDTRVTLPQGLSISPGIVDGIQACEESGPEGINFEGPESEETAPDGEPQLAPGHCPAASTVGEAEAETPLLASPVKGHVYLARPLCGGVGQQPCTEADALDGRLYQLYLELGGSGALADAGVNLKVRGVTEANPATGQLTTVFEDTPQLPFSELRVRLNGGPRAPLATPAACGMASTTANFTPWSQPGTTPEGVFMAGTPNAIPSSHFEVGGCSDPATLNPTLTAGMTTPQAGAFGAFTLDLSRQDREPYVKGIQLHTPPGLLGILASVPLCGAGEADAGSCSEASQIGTTRVASGAGSHPFEIEGNVYLTGPYDEAPFGLSIVVNVIAGPFNLGQVVVRARIAVNPENSTLTVTTDESGPHAVPQIIDGVPVRLQRISVDIDRPDFMFNPTSCAAQKIGAIVSGSGQASAGVSSPFAVSGCKYLAFKPKFTVSTSGQTSRADGANLDVKLSYPAGSLGNEANIASVKVDLPKQLPSRLKTLQQACPAATFQANPAACPAASVVGTVRASTPLLPVELTGPVYFVSHGGEAFPSLIVVLEGDGVRVDLTGATFISKAGITSSTFKTVPDVPVNTFELYLPRGRYSALAANGSLCKSASKLRMPTRFVAQNGAVVEQDTKIAVTGCKRTTASAALAARRHAAAGHATAGFRRADK
jgi:hypothetical protein